MKHSFDIGGFHEGSLLFSKGDGEMRKSYSIMAVLFVLIFCFSTVSFAGLTVTGATEDVWGKKRVKIKSIAFDSSYAIGGESLTKASLGLAATDEVIILPKNGYAFEYDYTNEKVKVMAKAPPVVYEEQHTISGNSIYLNYPAAFLMNVAQANANIKITTSGATVIAVSDECQPIGTWSEGARSGVTFGTSVTGTVYVTYVTQAWKEVWENVVQNEVVPLATNSGMFDYQAVAIQAATIIGGISTNSALMLDKDDTPATGELKVDWTSAGASTLTGVSTVAGDGGTSVYVTYVKMPSSGYLKDNFVEEETMAATAGTSNFVLNYKALLWGYGGQVPVNGATTQRLINTLGTTGTNEAYMNFRSGTSPWTQFVMGQNAASTTATYIQGNTGDVETSFLEVPNGRDLSNLTGVKVMLIGR
jgi:hypothetical protein